MEINPLVRPLVAWVGTEYIKKGLHFQVGKHIADNYVVDKLPELILVSHAQQKLSIFFTNHQTAGGVRESLPLCVHQR